MTKNQTTESELQRRIGELERQNRILERRISHAGEILGQEALSMAERANAWLAAVIESSDDAIVSKDLNGVVTSWNRAAERIFGYTASEMIGSSILRIIPPHLESEERYILAKIRAGERINHYETLRQRKDGQPVRISVSVSPVRDSTGAIVGASKVARDVTAQFEADRAQGLLAAIVASTDDAIISKDLKGVVTSWNPAAERLYGYKSVEMIGQSILRIIPVELRAEEDHILAQISAGHRIEHFETVRLAKDGRRVDVSLTVSPIRDAAGRVVGASKIARDVTEQRDAQRRKDEFLAVLAHELRNPLAPIRNAIAIFGDPRMDEPQRERARQIAERQFQHMARLLDDLLDVSRLSMGRVDLKLERSDLGDLVRLGIEATGSLMEAKHHHFEADLAAEPLPVDVDSVRIVQTVANLLTNAAKYTDPGGCIRITTRREGREAVVAISDNGIGFAPAMKERLFTAFSQEQVAVNRAAGGLGIGLALVRDFVTRHGGSVAAESPGRNLGSTFTVRLPLAG
jgi:PAS domain S-box-containing protein